MANGRNATFQRENNSQLVCVWVFIHPPWSKEAAIEEEMCQCYVITVISLCSFDRVDEAHQVPPEHQAPEERQ